MHEPLGDVVPRSPVRVLMAGSRCDIAHAHLDRGHQLDNGEARVLGREPHDVVNRARPLPDRSAGQLRTDLGLHLLGDLFELPDLRV